MGFDDVKNIDGLIDWDKLCSFTISAEKQLVYSVRELVNATEQFRYDSRILTELQVMGRYQLIGRAINAILLDYKVAEIVARMGLFLYDTARPYGILGPSHIIKDQIDSTATLSGGGIIGAAVTKPGGIVGAVEEY